jgi:hypothetical protein
MTRAFGRSGVATAIVAALMMSTGGAFPTDADAQSANSRNSRRAQPGNKPVPGPKLDRAKGAAEAPGVVRAAGVACTVTDAAYIGQTKNAAGTVQNGYEVACSEGLGYIIQVGAAGTTPTVFDCIVMDASARAGEAKGQKGMVRCQLPANLKAAQSLQPLVARAGGTCTVSDARYAGTNPTTGVTVYEISCAQGAGYMLQRPRDAATNPTLVSCLNYLGSPMPCALTPQEKVIASIVPVVANAKRTCDVTNARMAGQNPQTKNDIVEIGCGGGRPGFFAEVTPAGAFVRALDCDRVSGLACQFTNTAALQAAGREALLQRVAGAGLRDCTPADARLLGTETDTGRDVIEVSCANRQDGVIAVLASQKTARTEVFDCLFEARWSGRCELSRPSAVYPRVSSALRVRGKSPNCQISNARWMGWTPQGENWFEIACADGRSFLMDYRGNGQVASVMTCREGTGIGGGCRAGIGASATRE